MGVVESPDGEKDGGKFYSARLPDVCNRRLDFRHWVVNPPCDLGAWLDVNNGELPLPGKRPPAPALGINPLDFRDIGPGREMDNGHCPFHAEPRQSPPGATQADL